MTSVRRLLSLACAGIVAACSNATIATRHPGVLTIGIWDEPRSLNPLYLDGFNAAIVGRLGYSYLTSYDSRGRIHADVAAEVPTVKNGGITPDGKRITYHLRHGVQWQDGWPLTSRDIAFTYRAIVSPANSVPLRYPYDRIASVEMHGPFTLTVTMKRPYSPILYYFFGGDSRYAILPAHLLERYASLDHTFYNESPIGSGAYRFGTWARGDYIDLGANERYYAGKPSISRIRLCFVPEAATALNELLTGELSGMFLVGASQLNAMRAVPDHRVVIVPIPGFLAFTFNVTDPILRDLKVRRAFAMAIDQRALVANVTHGAYLADTARRGLFTWAFDPSAGKVPHDPSHAAELLTRDGWLLGRDGIRAKEGRRLELQFAYPSGNVSRNVMVPLVVEAERAIGIALLPRGYNDKPLYSIEGPLMSGRFQVAMLAYQSGYDPDASWMLSCAQRSPRGFNIARYCNPTVDRALERATATFDREARRREYWFVQRQLMADLPYDFIWQEREIDVLPSRLAGYGGPVPSPFSSAWQWHWRTNGKRSHCNAKHRGGHQDCH